MLTYDSKETMKLAVPTVGESHIRYKSMEQTKRGLTHEEDYDKCNRV